MSRVDIFDNDYGINPIKPYASRIFNCSVVGANEIMRLMDGNLPRDVWLSIVFEFMYFYIAMTRGYALNRVSADRKQELTTNLIDLLIPRVVDYIFDLTNAVQAKALADRYVRMTIARLKVYDEYKTLLPASERTLKGTAAGSLCDAVAELAGHRGNPMYEMVCFSHLTESMDFLKIKSFVASIK